MKKNETGFLLNKLRISKYISQQVSKEYILFIEMKQLGLQIQSLSKRMHLVDLFTK